MMDPLAYGACRDTAERCIESAKKAGCKALLGGARPMSPDMADGAFVLPTVFEVSDNKLDLMREEIFAPVVGIMKVSTPEEAVELTNDSRYGLCASVWTADYRKALRLIDRLEVGTVWVNQRLKIVPETPWGGCKDSGWTKENSMLVFDEYTFHKHVWLELGDKPHTFWEDKLDIE